MMELMHLDENDPFGRSTAREVNVTLDKHIIEVALFDDHIENADGTTTPADYHRSIAIELLEDGGLQILLYPVNSPEPETFVLDGKGNIEKMS